MWGSFQQRIDRSPEVYVPGYANNVDAFCLFGMQSPHPGAPPNDRTEITTFTNLIEYTMRKHQLIKARYELVPLLHQHTSAKAVSFHGNKSELMTKPAFRE
jgi:hypothetical protein